MPWPHFLLCSCSSLECGLDFLGLVCMQPEDTVPNIMSLSECWHVESFSRCHLSQEHVSLLQRHFSLNVLFGMNIPFPPFILHKLHICVTASKCGSRKKKKKRLEAWVQEIPLPLNCYQHLQQSTAASFANGEPVAIGRNRMHLGNLLSSNIVIVQSRDK